MKSEPFWGLEPQYGCEPLITSGSSMRSISNLKQALKYALIDKELFELISDKQSSNILIEFLTEYYFSNSKKLYYRNYIDDINSQIVYDNREDYVNRVKKLMSDLGKDSYQEEIFIRSGVFKKQIPKIYNYTCCISRLNITSTTEVSMIDACHIIPFSESYNDTISNGLALCPNIHRAFDRGLISISEDYRVLINSCFTEDESSSFNLKQFKDKRILLPDNKNHLPSLEYLYYHRKKFGFN